MWLGNLLVSETSFRLEAHLWGFQFLVSIVNFNINRYQGAKHVRTHATSMLFEYSLEEGTIYSLVMDGCYW